MKKQFLSAITMCSCILLLACASVQAQSAPTLVADIPFDFTIAKKSLPAGRYIVQSGSSDGKITRLIHSSDNDVSMYLLTNSVQTSTAPEQGKLVFRRYGDQYFLAQIWTPGDNYGRELPIRHKERVTIRELAKKSATPQQVTLKARVP